MEDATLSRYDDLLCHQIAAPFEQTASSDRNMQERVHFLAHDIEGRYLVDAGFGYYPNRNVIDGWCGIGTAEGAHYFRASRRLRPQIDAVEVGPLRYDVIEGLSELKLTLGENPAGFRFDVGWHATFPANGPEFHFQRQNGRIVHDLCRFYQMGRPSGWIEIAGERVEIDAASWRCHRDRSWGIRPWMPGGQDGMEPEERTREGSFYHFTYLQFEDWAEQHHVVDAGNGAPGFLYGAVVEPLSKDGKQTEVIRMRHDTQFEPNSITLASDRIEVDTEDGQTRVIEAEAIGARFPTSAVGGYQGWKGWQQSTFMGDYWEDAGTIDYRDPEQFASVMGMWDYVCALRCGDERGSGVVEAIPFG